MPSNIKYPFPPHLLSKKDYILEIIEESWRLNRTAVNPETDLLAAKLLSRAGRFGRLHEFESGSECLTWSVPQRWNVREGYIETLNGRRLVDFHDNPLHLWTHSVSVQGEFTMEELNPHILTHEERPDEFEYHFRNGYRRDVREWGFSIPHAIVSQMQDERYRVCIDADLDDTGTMKVVDITLPGESPETLLFMAHTCHPGMVNDGLACVATAMALFDELQRNEHRHYTYRFIFGPEYFGAAAWLGTLSAEERSNLKFGCFLDMLGNHEPLGMQRSYQGDSRLDWFMENILRTHVGTHIVKPYRKLWPNDEMFYNAAGFWIPTIGLGRGMYREYHFNSDDIDHFSPYKSVEALWVLLRLVEAFETDFVPRLRYEGPIYLSGQGLYVDPYRDPDAYDLIEHMQIHCDGEAACGDIAQELDGDLFFIRDFFDQLVDRQLAEKRFRGYRPGDGGTLTRGARFGDSTVGSIKFPWEK